MNSLLSPFSPSTPFTRVTHPTHVHGPARTATTLRPLRRPLAALALALATALPGAALLASLPGTARAQGTSNATRNATPQIKSFSVQAPDRARPGDEISFRLEGSPGASARVQVPGVQRAVVLAEVRSGLYEGSHVLRRGERLDRDLRADATLTRGQRSAQRQWVADRPAELACADCGRVTAVDKLQVKGDGNNVAGTIIGGVLGGVVGNQVGGGSGRDAARIVGAIGGAYAGNRIQNRNNAEEIWRVTVRLRDGRTQTFDYADDPGVALGTPVRLQDGVLVRL